MLVALDDQLIEQYASKNKTWVTEFDDRVFSVLHGDKSQRNNSDYTLSGTVTIEGIECLRCSVDWHFEKMAIINGIDVRLKVVHDADHA